MPRPCSRKQSEIQKKHTKKYIRTPEHNAMMSQRVKEALKLNPRPPKTFEQQQKTVESQKRYWASLDPSNPEELARRQKIKEAALARWAKKRQSSLDQA